MALETVYLSLGSNLGDRHANLTSAVVELEKSSIKVQRTSSLYETEPVDLAEQPWFLNIVLEAKARVSPFELLATAQKIEHDMGRFRTNEVHRGPRTIDIDILLFGNLSMTEEQLIIPHPRMTVRRFVLEPLVEIAPEIQHPATCVPYRDYLPSISGQQVRKLVHG